MHRMLIWITHRYVWLLTSLHMGFRQVCANVDLWDGEHLHSSLVMCAETKDGTPGCQIERLQAYSAIWQDMSRLLPSGCRVATVACKCTWKESATAKKQYRCLITSSRTVPFGSNRATSHSCGLRKPAANSSGQQQICVEPSGSWQQVDWGSEHSCRTSAAEEEDWKSHAQTIQHCTLPLWKTCLDTCWLITVKAWSASTPLKHRSAVKYLTSISSENTLLKWRKVVALRVMV